MGPTITDGSMSKEDAMIITTIKRGSVDRPHLGLITIHPKNPKETNSNELLPLVFGGTR